MSTTVAVLGTGIMGAGMTRSLLREGLEVTVWNRSTDKAKPLADDGARVAGTAADAVAGADVVITMLFDTDAVAQTIEPVLPRFRDGAVWVQASTVGIEGTDRLAALARDAGVDFLDSPMLGTKAPGRERSARGAGLGSVVAARHRGARLRRDRLTHPVGERDGRRRQQAQARHQRLDRRHGQRHRAVDRARPRAGDRPAAVPRRRRRRRGERAVRAAQGQGHDRRRVHTLVRARRRHQGHRPDHRGPARGGRGPRRSPPRCATASRRVEPTGTAT